MSSVTASAAPQVVKADYTGFGLHGQDFQKLHEMTWNVILDTWQSMSQEFGLPPFEAAMAQALDRDGYLFERLMLLPAVFKTISNPEFVELWNQFRLIFSPALRSGQELSERSLIILRSQLLQTIVKVRMTDPIKSRRHELNTGTCEGIFRGDEMAYLLSRYPDILDFAGGSGYATKQFNDRGGNAIAVDNNSYGWTRPDAVPWTRELVDSGRLIIGGLECIQQHAAGRALGLFYPEPGALYPAAALRAYAAAGGNTLLLKLGAFIGGVRSTADPTYVPPLNPDRNVLRFVRELIAGGWREITDPDRPAWIPQALDNNLIIFERPEHPSRRAIAMGAPTT